MQKTNLFQILVFGATLVLVLIVTAAAFAKPELETNLILSAEEKAWLRDHQTIKIAGPRSFPPFHYFDKDGALKGISADYVKSIMASLGVRVDVQVDLPWPEVLRRARAKEVDLISCSAKTTDRESYLNFSIPYLSFPLVIISGKNAPFIGGLDDLHGKKVAVIRGISTYEWLLRDEIHIVPYFVDTPLQALEAVSYGRADANIENLAAASYLIQTTGLINIKIAAPTSYSNYNLHIAVRKDWPELVSIINKALEAIPPEDHSSIRNKWLSVRYEYGIRGLDIVKWVALSVTIAVAILLVVLSWNRRLKKVIAEREKAEKNREMTIRELQEALDNIKILNGLLPICAHCKKIRDDSGYWNHLESYLEQHSDAQFSHGLCIDCAKELYGDSNWYKKKYIEKDIKR